MTTKVPTLMLTDPAREGVLPFRAPAIAGDWPMMLSAPFSFTIQSVADLANTPTGTLDWRIEINGVPVVFPGVDGSGNLTADNTVGVVQASSDNIVAPGDVVFVIISNVINSPAILALDIKLRRTA